MGNLRQQQQKALAAELRRKLNAMEELLEGLRRAQSGLRAECEEAKSRVNSAVAELTSALTERGRLLSREIESLHGVEERALQDSIHSTLLAIGSLQFTLDNLDSMGVDQLERVVEGAPPEASVQARRIELKLDDGGMRERIEGWGRAIVEPEPGSSMQQQQEATTLDSFDLLMDCSSSSSTCSEFDACEDAPELCAQLVASVNFGGEDLAQWLHPERKTSGCNIDQERSSPVGSADSTISSPRQQQPQATPSKAKYIDFPCLRLDPGCWLPRRRMKDPASLESICVEPCSGSEGCVIPPSYALPYPFWLRGK